ncbi:MAG TPA: hypothetical protein VK929_11680 [Longimicrobiales bacterium]|nr:hypothetical protein [Longimicrobiales bacterium]
MIHETEQSESLAGVPVGVEVEVVQALLPGGVSAGGDHALRKGSRWRCRLNGTAIMLLHNRGGRMVSLRRDEARYIQVRRLGGDSIQG